MWELVHMSDVSLESDVARVRNSPRLFWQGMCISSGGSESKWVGGWTIPSCYFMFGPKVGHLCRMRSMVSFFCSECELHGRLFHPSVGFQFFPKHWVDGEALVRRVV